MKAFAVDPMAPKPTVIVRTGETIERLEFRTKRQADKKIMELIERGYEFDATHEKVGKEPAQA